MAVSTRTTLIRLLGQNRISDPADNLGQIVANAFHKQSLDEIEQSVSDFPDLWASLGQKKRVIESCLDLHDGDPVNQAAGCLSLMRGEFELNKIDDATDYGDLVAEMPEYASWPEPIRKKFDAARTVMCEWRAYFLSYTNRNADETNQLFQRLITVAWGRWPRQSERDGVNYVARIVAKYLRENNLIGFFDPKDIRCGDDIEEQILHYSQNCASLVQLVERCSFSRPEHEKENWCHREYKAFFQSSIATEFGDCGDQRRHFAITTEPTVDQLKPVAPVPEYHDWWETTERKHVAALADITSHEARIKITEIAKDLYRSHLQLAKCMVESLYE